MKFNERELKKDLDAVRTLLWHLAEELTWAELNARSGLHPRTVRRFFTGETANPSFRTVYAIAYSVGVRLSIDKQGLLRMRVA